MKRRGWVGVAVVAAGVGLAVTDAGGGSHVAAAVATVTAVVVVLVGLAVAGDRPFVDADRWRPTAAEGSYLVPVPGDEDPTFVGARPRRFGGRSDGDQSAEERDERDDTAGASPAPAATVERATGHWTGVAAVALVLGGLGVLSRTPGLALSGAVGAAFAGYAGAVRPAVGSPGTGEPSVTVRRSLSNDTPDPGDAVTVTVGVRNESDAVLSDVRVVDGVPAELSVTEGSARHGAPLRPGGETVFSYTVRAGRGEHDWDPAQVTVADPSGAVEYETAVRAETAMRCTLPALDSERVPLGGTTAGFAGRVETDEGGPGVEFHATREYRRSDPLSRVDWGHMAKTGEFATVEFREERSATVQIVVDVRRAAYRAPTPDGYHAVQRGVDAAYQVFEALLDTGDRVGVTTLGRSRETCWLPPGADRDHRARGRELLSVHPALSPVPPEQGLYDRYPEDRRETLERRRIDRLHRRLGPNTQVMLIAPCCDDYPRRVARRLAAYGRTVTVVSPDPTVRDTPDHERAAAARDERLSALRATGVRVVDWRDGERFGAALARAKRRWSA